MGTNSISDRLDESNEEKCAKDRPHVPKIPPYQHNHKQRSSVKNSQRITLSPRSYDEEPISHPGARKADSTPSLVLLILHYHDIDNTNQYKARGNKCTHSTEDTPMQKSHMDLRVWSHIHLCAIACFER